MPSIIQVEVSEDDINKAIRSNSAKCVVAQAVARTLPDASRIDVNMQTVRYTRNGKRYEWLTPQKVLNYIVEFDAGDHIEPFTFRLTRGRTTHRRSTDANARETMAAQKRLHNAEARRARIAEEAGVPVESVPLKLTPSRDGQVTAEETVIKAAQPVIRPVERGEAPAMRRPKVGVGNRGYGHRELRENQDRFSDDPEVRAQWARNVHADVEAARQGRYAQPWPGETVPHLSGE